MDDTLPGQGRRVLIVDDDRAIRELLHTVLEFDGWEVLEAVDGAHALALARAENPVAVLLDVMMPAVDGFDVLDGLRKTEQGRAMTIIMLTAKSRPSDVLQGTRLGADLYIAKPFDPTDVAAKLAEQVQKRTEGA